MGTNSALISSICYESDLKTFMDDTSSVGTLNIPIKERSSACPIDDVSNDKKS